MENSRQADKLLRQLESALGEVDVESLISLQPERKQRDVIFSTLENLLADGNITCSSERISTNSKVAISEHGLDFLYSGGYSMKKKGELAPAPQTREPVMQYLITVIAVFGLIFLLYFLMKLMWSS